MGHIMYKKRLREFDMFSLRRGGFVGDNTILAGDVKKVGCKNVVLDAFS